MPGHELPGTVRTHRRAGARSEGAVPPGALGQHGSASASGAFYRSTGCRVDIRSSFNEWTGNGVALDLSRVVPTADENRPVNMAVRYLVRARP